MQGLSLSCYFYNKTAAANMAKNAAPAAGAWNGGPAAPVKLAAVGAEISLLVSALKTLD